MLWQSPRIEASNARLWRYMSFPAYVWLLRTKSLFFSRLDLLGDPSEGARTDSLERRMSQVSAKARMQLTKLRPIVESFFAIELPQDVATWPSLYQLREQRYSTELNAIERLFNRRAGKLRFLEDLDRNYRHAEEHVLSPKI